MKALLTGVTEAYRSIWTTYRRGDLPVRALRSIQRSDDMSEVLVKAIQFAVFSLFGLVYLAAPVPNPDTISRVPLVVSIYLAFTLATLVLAIMRSLPGWLIYLSILLDVTLLTYLIYSFHIQYGQPASFSLKSPSILVYFVLIGLRTLRFEARYVVAAGLASILGWIVLVIYVIQTDPLDPMITRDYVTYLTSNTVLIGAEVDKIISMLLLTIVLAIAVRRAHSFLVVSVAESNAAQDLARFMPNSVAEHIRDADDIIHAGDGVRREAAILNVDIRGFTDTVSQLDPQETMAILSDYQHEIVPLVHKHGGLVDKFMGDGILITFGASTADPRYCANALRCADEILAAQPNWSGPAKDMNVNLAVVSGPVTHGAVGYGDRLEFTVIGPAVNRSAKLEKYNKVLGTRGLCEEVSYQLAIKQGYEGKSTNTVEKHDYQNGGHSGALVVLA